MTWCFPVSQNIVYFNYWDNACRLFRQWYVHRWTSPVAQMVKHLSTMWETGVWSLDWEDPLEKEMAIHFRTIAWKIPWTEEPGRLQSMGSQRVRHNWATSLSLSELLWRVDEFAYAKCLDRLQDVPSLSHLVYNTIVMVSCAILWTHI